MLVAAIGCIGVAIGVAALVLVLSFMNGADAQLGGQIASADGQIFVTRRNPLGTWSGVQQAVRHQKEVAVATASLNVTAMITVQGRSIGAELQGIKPTEMHSIPALAPGAAALIGHAPLQTGTVAIGSGLATQLGVSLGDHVTLTFPRLNAGIVQIDNFDAQIAGVVNTGISAFDRSRVIMPADDLRSRARFNRFADKISIWLNSPEQEQGVNRLRQSLGPDVLVRTWREMNRSLVAALYQERLAMTTIISLVTIIALSNITSSMVMMVRQRSREIAILRTMGMSRYSVARVFIGVGAVIGMVGELAGLAIGFGLKLAKDPVAQALQARMSHPPYELKILLSIPLAITTNQIAWIFALVSTGVILSTLYPALRAAAVDPAVALHYT